MKKIVLLATILAITALTSCTEDTYVGEQNLKAINEGAISFGSATPAVTRAGEGAIAAGLLNNNFVLFGYKTLSDESGTQTQTVFDNYQVNYVANTANTTESNTADWEYVNYKNLPYGTGMKAEEVVTLNNNGVAANATASGIEQSIKYWDFSASQYDFFAYSLGAGEADNGDDDTEKQYAKASPLSNSSTYTLEGTKAQLGTCYISNKKSVSPELSATQVQLEFRSFLSKIQLKFYETIPGYSVKDVKFYIDGSTKSTGAENADGLRPAIYGAANAIPTGGTYTITFDSENHAQAALEGASSSTSSVLFDEVSSGVWLSAFAAKEYEETVGTQFLARASNTATSTKQMTVLPNSNGATLTLKVDFTLVSRDKTGETIEVTGATATVPAAYTMWKPNYAYTYIFKISDDTNAQSGSVPGLYPITLDAVVADAQDGSQTTITTVSTPSITTYQKGAIANEYNAGNIYIVVENGTAITVNTNAKLYTAVITLEEGENPRPAAQGITEETVKNALTQSPNGSGVYEVTDANGAKLTVTPVATTEGTTDRLQAIAAEGIPASDTPDGKAIVVNGAWFNAKADKNYVFEYFVDAVNYKEDEANTYNAELPGAITTSNSYSFTSFGSETGSPQYGTGMVKVVSTNETSTIVEVISNNPNDANAASFVGQQFKVNATATSLSANAYYRLYETDDTETTIYVKVASSTSGEVNAYNATLPGAVSTSDVKTAAAKYYKVIKVVAAP